MLKFGLTVAAVAMLATSTAALAGETYVGASAGINIQSKSKNKGTFTTAVPATAAFPAIAADTPLAWTTKFDKGLDLNILGGYRFDNGVRIELQGAYNRAGVDRHSNLAVGGTVIDAVDSAVLTRGAPAATNPTVGQVLSTDKGKIKTLGVFGNLLYDIKASDKFMPYLGAGVGFARTTVAYNPSAVAVVNDKKTVFAYQAIAGATYKISPSFELFGQYTFRDANKAKTNVSLVPATLNVKNRQSIFNVGFRIPFGGAE
jgi:opacity protein-like surface antigen